jgi:assimilatory nitrate reductase catalytic subunit
MNSRQACTQTTCPYCGVGCGVDGTVAPGINGVPGQLLGVKGTASHPANLGRLCVKGSALHEAVGTAGRLLHPEVDGQRVSWDSALDTVASRFQAVIDEHGPDAVAFYLSGQLLTEDYYVANKLMKGFIGSANVDTNSRLCMASAVAGYKRAFGADAVPCNYEDLERCDLLVLIGSNAAWTHPVLYQRISAAKAARPGMRIVAIDPRRTATCDLADLFLPLLPGSDAFLFNGLLHWLHGHRHFDQYYLAHHCEGHDELLAALAQCDLSWTSRHTGLPEAQLLEFFSLFGSTEKVVTFYSQGINQSATGTDKCNAIINCHLVTGRIGREGMGPFSITGQPNAMGGREVGGLANQLAAHMDFKAADIERVARFWQAPRIATTAGLKAVDMFRAVKAGRIKALWIMGTNPAVSLPQSEDVHAALQRCEFVVVSDCVRHTETTQYAQVLLPATGWSEKDGTVTNSERRISRQRALLLPAGEARHDWEIVSAVAQRLGFGAAFSYSSPREVFIEHAALSGFENQGQRAFDISALQSLDAAAYEALAPVQWPVTAAAPQGTARLFGDGRFYTPSGKARLLPVVAEAPAISTSPEHPFLLNTGRLRDQWHTMTRTGQVARLLQHTPSPFVALHPDTAAKLHIAEAALVAVSSKHGALLLPARFDAGLRPDAVFVPIHWNARFASNARVSKLLSARVDPHSGQPESKVEAVALAAVPMAQWLTLLSREPLPDALFNGEQQVAIGTDIGASSAVAGSCSTTSGISTANAPTSSPRFAYWDWRPVKDGYCYRFATTCALDATQLRAWLQAAPAAAAARLIDFHDASQHDHRMLLLRDQDLQAALFSAATPYQLPPAEWLQRLMSKPVPANEWLLLAGRELDSSSKGALICSCHEVGKDEIIAAIRMGARDTQSLGKLLRCGTGCGSCIPELKQVLAAETAKPSAAVLQFNPALPATAWRKSGPE